MKLGKYRQGHQIASDDELDTLLKHWDVPEVKDTRRKVEGRSTAIGTPLADLYREKQPKHENAEDEFEQVTPLSVAEIEQIREEAYQEGLTEGKEAGYQTGFDEGKHEGAAKGFEEGITQGKEEGLQQARAEIDNKLTQLDALLASMEKPFNVLDKEVEKQLVLLASKLAKAIVLTEVKQNPMALMQAINHATSALKNQSNQIEIHVNPLDYENLATAYGEQELAKRQWKLFAEPSISQGGCVIKGQGCSIDYTLETRMQEILDNFLQEAHISDNQEM
jgi:flagellar assembly protein FliH